MEITDVRVFPVEEEKLKAFVSMPSKKRRNGTFRDIAHPLNNETRQKIEEQIISRYKVVVAEEGREATTPLRELESGFDPRFHGPGKGDPTWP